MGGCLPWRCAFLEPQILPFDHPVPPPLSESRFTFNRHLLNLPPLNLGGMEGLRLITDVIEGPAAPRGPQSGRELPAAAPAPGPPHPRLRVPSPPGPMPPWGLCLATQGCRRQTHGVAEEDEQLLQAGLAQELHIGLAEGE